MRDNNKIILQRKKDGGRNSRGRRGDYLTEGIIWDKKKRLKRQGGKNPSRKGQGERTTLWMISKTPQIAIIF